MSEYTPTVGELRQAYVEASGATVAQESYYAEQVAEFERGIARIKAEAVVEALHEAASAMEGEDAREWPFSGMDEMQRWLSERADQIEKEEQ